MVGLGSGPVGAPEPSPTTVTIFLRLRRGYELGAFRRNWIPLLQELGMRWRRAKRENRLRRSGSGWEFGAKLRRGSRTRENRRSGSGPEWRKDNRLWCASIDLNTFFNTQSKWKKHLLQCSGRAPDRGSWFDSFGFSFFCSV